MLRALVGIAEEFSLTRRQVRVLAVGLAVMAAVGVALFGGLIPGLAPNYSAPLVTTIAGHQYDELVVPLHPPPTSNAGPVWNVSFRNVTFELQLTDWYSSAGGIVLGKGIELDGSNYSFELGQMYPNGSRTMLYVSPDAIFGASFVGGWIGGLTLTLLVQSSYPSLGTSGQPPTND